MALQTRYQQIAEDLRRRIESQEFPEGTSLPTELELEGQYQASRNTVREAIKLLVHMHLLETRAGQGTFVTEAVVPFVTTLSNDPRAGSGGGEGANYPALIREQGRQICALTPEVKLLGCPAEIAERLGIAAGDSVVSRQEERYIDRAAWSLQTTYYPMKWVSLGATGLLEPRAIPGGAIQHIAEAIGRRQVGYRDWISARLPDDRERSLFNLRHHDSVIEIYRTSFTEDATPLRVTVTVFPSHRNQIVYDIGSVPADRREPTTTG
jgi:GntR family transcriptional regulator